MLRIQKFMHSKCYAVKKLCIQNVMHSKCYAFKILCIQSVLHSKCYAFKKFVHSNCLHLKCLQAKSFAFKMFAMKSLHSNCCIVKICDGITPILKRGIYEWSVSVWKKKTSKWLNRFAWICHPMKVFYLFWHHLLFITLFIQKYSR